MFFQKIDGLLKYNKPDAPTARSSDANFLFTISIYIKNESARIEKK